MQTAQWWYSIAVFSAMAENSTAVEQLSSVTAQLQSSTAMKQHGSRPWSEVAPGPGPSPARELCSAPLLLALLCSALLCLLVCALVPWDVFAVSALAGETQPPVFSVKEKCPLQARGELTYADRSPCPWFLIGMSSCEWGLQIFTTWLIQKNTVLFGQNGAAQISWWKCLWGYRCAALIGWGKPQS